MPHHLEPREAPLWRMEGRGYPMGGAPVATVAQRAGHKTAYTTMTTYAHAIAGSDRDLMAGLNEDYLRSAAGP